LSDFSGELSDEACNDIDLSSGELAKSEVALQDSLGAWSDLGRFEKLDALKCP
jgi:hypothetical protein